MRIKDLQKDHKIEKASISISFRITKAHSEFMKKNNVSPTKLFRASVEELMKETK